MAVSMTQRWCVMAGVLLGTSALALAALRSSTTPPHIVTTAPEIAITNLESQISSLERAPELVANRFEFRRQYVNLLLMRARYFGRLSDFLAVEKLTKETPVSLDEHLLRARFLIAVHRFDEALQILANAEVLDPSMKEIQRSRRAIRLARREDLPALRLEQNGELEKERSYGNLLVAAGIESELGNFDVADSLFEEAIKNLHDTSPFPFSYLCFQRGLMWSEKAGDQDRGLLYYEEALRYLPQFVVARIHLSEILNSNGDKVAAKEHLKQVIQSEDPEAKGFFGEILKETGAESEAAAYISEATNSYNKLLSQYPLAFSDHGAEFFAGPGSNPGRALELAQLNLKNRKTERSYIVAIEAAQAAHAPEVYCQLASEAGKIKPVFNPLKDLIKELSTECPAAP